MMQRREVAVMVVAAVVVIIIAATCWMRLRQADEKKVPNKTVVSEEAAEFLQEPVNVPAEQTNSTVSNTNKEEVSQTEKDLNKHGLSLRNSVSVSVRSKE